MSAVIPAPSLRQATAALLADHVLQVRLPWRALKVSGPDAQTFLQGQVTCDMREITPAQSRLGCLLNLKGRIQASFRAVAVADGYLLLLPEEQLAAAQARLAKYGVFSKITLDTPDVIVTGLAGQPLHQSWPEAVNSVAHDEAGTLIRLPGNRALHLGTQPLAGDSQPADAALAAWRCLEVRSGEILVAGDEQEKFQPQELDYHTLHGVSYQKGCYLGQEIVARLYFRGQLKTGLQCLRVNADTVAPVPGQAILADGKSVGEIIRVSWPDTTHAELLALVRLDAGALTLALDGQEQPLEALPLTR